VVTQAGFIGLGSHGWPMAANLASAGFDLIVYDRRERPLQALDRLGVRIARTAREVGEHGGVIGVAEIADPGWDDDQVEAVILGEAGVLSGAKPGTVLAFHSAIYPSTVRRIAEQARTRGVEVVDAQANGGEGRARARQLCYLLGGDTAVLERCQPVFATSGSSFIYMGELGTGAAAKIAHYSVVCATIVAASEGFRLAETAGVDLAAFQEMLRVSAGQSWVTDHWLQEFSPIDGERAESLYHRLGHALGLGHELDVALPGTELARQALPLLRPR